MKTDLQPLVRFYRMIGETRLPQRADRSAAGTLPTRAYRYCEAVCNATGFGWWLFPPSDVMLLWDGQDIFWSMKGLAWTPLQPAVQFPAFRPEFNTVAPPELEDCAPPFLTALPEPGVLQIWTGLIARTSPGWQLLLRSPANLPLPGGYALYEGIVATDHWFGPLFTNLRFTRTHAPVRLRNDFPLALAQPVQRHSYSDDVLGDMEIAQSMKDLRPEDWEAYRTTIVIPNQEVDRPFGSYASAERKRRKQRCPASMPADRSDEGCRYG